VGGLRVDVFVPAIPYYQALAHRTRNVTLLGRPATILGPEDLVILKMMFFRRKDLADVEALVREQGADLDRDFVRRTLVELVGTDDERVSTFDAIVRDVDAARDPRISTGGVPPRPRQSLTIRFRAVDRSL